MSDLRQRQRRPPLDTPYPPPTNAAAAPKRKKGKQHQDSWLTTVFQMTPFIILLPVLYYVLQRQAGSGQTRDDAIKELRRDASRTTRGHWDFGDRRETNVEAVWTEGCKNCYWVNTNLGNGG